MIVITHTRHIAAALGEEAEPEILRDIGVLVLVDEHIFEALLIGLQHIGVLAEEAQIFEQEIAEVSGVQLLQAFLIERVELAAFAIRKSGCFTRRDFVGGQAAVFPAINEGGERTGGPSFLVNILGADHLPHETDLVVGV